MKPARAKSAPVAVVATVANAAVAAAVVATANAVAVVAAAAATANAVAAAAVVARAVTVVAAVAVAGNPRHAPDFSKADLLAEARLFHARRSETGNLTSLPPTANPPADLMETFRMPVALDDLVVARGDMS